MLRHKQYLKARTVATPIAGRSNRSSSSNLSSNVSSNVSLNIPELSIFPPSLETETDSMSLMKRMLASTVSTVCFLRNIFPEDCFVDKTLPGKGVVKILSNGGGPDGNENGKAILILRYLLGAFDALEKKYLRTLIFGIACDPTDPRRIHESYTFSFEYKEDGGVSFTVAGENSGQTTKKITERTTKESVIQVLRQLALMITTMDALPEGDQHLIVKLFYYNDRTPKDYEPPGFRPSKESDFLHSANAMERPLGCTATNFHSVSVAVRSIFADVDDEEEEEEAESQNGTPE